MKTEEKMQALAAFAGGFGIQNQLHLEAFLACSMFTQKNAYDVFICKDDVEAKRRTYKSF